jgi:putative membrane protein
MQRSFKEYLIISLKGLAMGAADVVPGVSGGTIAFISGIYEELLESINAVNFNALKTLKSEGFKAMWKSINGNFLFSLVLGIGISIVSFAKLIKWLLENEPILVWSFFFGLVIASVIFVAKQIKKWNFMTIFMLLIGTGIGYYITILPPMAGNYTSNWFFFIAGSLAICAMILPGISGGFILLILGAYKPALDALHDRDIKTILLLISGAVVGLLTFSRLLKWLFDKYHTLTLAVLTGFILGSLNKIWPWKEILTWRTNSHGVKVPFSEKSISPFTYEGNPELLWAVILAIIGFLVIVLLEKSATIKTN